MRREVWKDIPNYEGLYKASNMGRIMSKTGKIKRGTPDKDGYLRVTLSKCSCEKNYRVNRLILLTFRGPCPAGMVGRHLDGTRNNNILKNLRWGTHKQNMHDKYKHGTMHNHKKGFASPLCKLTPEKVKKLKSYKGKYSQREAACFFGISQSWVCKIWRGHIYA